jgi:hypothetical protein
MFREDISWLIPAANVFMILNNLKNHFRHLCPASALSFSRPIVLFQSDDWGFLGIRDREGFDELRGHGLGLGSHPYDFYSLETGDDLHRLYDVLSHHHDSEGRHPCFVFNFVMANVDFPKVIESGFKRLELVPLAEGLPGKWKRPGLLKAYQEGIENGLIYPAFHGLTHFSQRSVEGLMQGQDGDTRLLRVLYASETPALYGRPPRIDFEYRHTSDGRNDGWLERSTQQMLVRLGKEIFEGTFGRSPLSACAPGYRANSDTWSSWAGEGIRVAQNGPGFDLAPHFDSHGLLHLYRNVAFEPALDAERFDERYAMNKAEAAIGSGMPAIVNAHSINFHSTLKNYLHVTLGCLDRFLTMVERKYEDLLYAHDEDILSLVTRGELARKGQKINLDVSHRLQPSPLSIYYWKRMSKSSRA